MEDKAPDRAPAPLHGLCQGAVVAVTGANRGIGLGLVRALALAGARILAHARTEAAARAVAAELGGLGATSAVVAGDVRDPALGARLCQAAATAFGRLDALVLNAGVLGPMATLLDTPRAAVEEVLAVNVVAPWELLRAAHPLLAASGHGVVVWLTSTLGRIGLPRYGAYCASKHALEGLMKVAAAEHASDGIVHLAVAPGMVQTEMLRDALGTQDLASYLTPAEVGCGLVRLLAEARGSRKLNGRSIDLARWLA